jgi:DNA modification methylase
MDWTFAKIPTTELTHGIIEYPAALHPNIAKELIRMYGKEGGVMLDPFVGSGTTLVEARLGNMRGEGFDINPLAVLISRVKSLAFEDHDFSMLPEKISASFRDNELPHYNEAAAILNLSPKEADSWYPKRTCRELGLLISVIDRLESQTEQFVCFIAVGELLRKLSYQRLKETKKYRKEGWRSFEENQGYTPALALFSSRLELILKSMDELKQCIVEPDFLPNIHLFNSSANPDFPPSAANVDLVITSPPYGDSKTTVAYEQFTWFANNGLGLDTRPDGALGREMLGGIIPQELPEKFGHRVTDTTLRSMPPEVRKKNTAFLHEYLQSINNVAKNVAEGGVVCYVVGNRSWKGAGGNRLRLDLFTKWAFEQNGFRLIGKIIQRQVIMKKQPSKSSNDGVTDGAGDVSDSMNYEYIVRLRKI